MAVRCGQRGPAPVVQTAEPPRSRPRARAARLLRGRPSARIRPRGNPSRSSCHTGGQPSMFLCLEQKISLRERQHRSGLAPKLVSIGRHNVRFRIDVHLRRRAVELHVCFRETTAAAHRVKLLQQSVPRARNPRRAMLLIRRRAMWQTLPIRTRRTSAASGSAAASGWTRSRRPSATTR